VQPSLDSTFRWLVLVTSASATVACMSSSTDGCEPVRESSTERTVSAEQWTQAMADAEVTQAECLALCDAQYWAVVDSCSAALSSDGNAAGPGEGQVGVSCKIEGVQAYCEGRRHASWGRRETPVGTDLAGRWLADAAANEAASVQSFRCLVRELRGCGLRSRVALRRAAQQEIGHARLLDRLAAARGSMRPKQSYHFGKARSLFEVALENAREGCVAETYAGLVALHQAQTARDPQVRRAFASIARDESEHAELAWALHAELRAKLTKGGRRRLDEALEAALTALETRESDWMKGLAADAASETVRRAAAELGIPARDVDYRLRQGLAGVLRERASQLTEA